MKNGKSKEMQTFQYPIEQLNKEYSKPRGNALILTRHLTNKVLKTLASCDNKRQYAVIPAKVQRENGLGRKRYYFLAEGIVLLGDQTESIDDAKIIMEQYPNAFFIPVFFDLHSNHFREEDVKFYNRFLGNNEFMFFSFSKWGITIKSMNSVEVKVSRANPFMSEHLHRNWISIFQNGTQNN